MYERCTDNVGDFKQGLLAGVKGVKSEQAVLMAESWVCRRDTVCISREAWRIAKESVGTEHL